jgi:outer membrane lipase/esterase
VNYRDTRIDGFRESGGTGVELAYENQNIVSLTTQAGVYASIAISTGMGVIVPQTTVEYVHEFLDDQRTVGFRFVQDLRRRKFLYQTDPPDRDYVNVALGVPMFSRVVSRHSPTSASSSAIVTARATP